jgi:peptide/nickel transport system permease protein
MVRFLAERLTWALVTLFLFVSLVFVAVNVLVPYDYATGFWLQGGPEMVEAVRERLGLNESLWDRYVALMSGLATLDLGRSFGGERVTEIVAEALPVTVLAFALGGVVAYLFGDWLGRVVAWRRRRLLSASATTASVTLHTAFPPLLVFVLMYFAVGPLIDARLAFGLPLQRDVLWGGPVTESHVMTVLAMAVVAAVTVALVVRAQARRRGSGVTALLALPLSVLGAALAVWALGIGPHAVEVLVRVTGIGAEQAANPLGTGSGTLGNLLVAAVALMLIAFGEVAMVVRAGMDNELEEDYVTTARAKGVPEVSIRDRHVARNAILPVLSRAIIGVPFLLSGLIIIERELQLSGLSWVLFDAVARVDVPLIIGVLVVIGVLVLVLRLVLDVMHVALDPRIRLTRGGA